MRTYWGTIRAWRAANHAHRNAGIPTAATRNATVDSTVNRVSYTQHIYRGSTGLCMRPRDLRGDGRVDGGIRVCGRSGSRRFCAHGCGTPTPDMFPICALRCGADARMSDDLLRIPDLVSKAIPNSNTARPSGAEYLAGYVFGSSPLDGGERYEVINGPSPEKLCRILILSCVQPCF